MLAGATAGLAAVVLGGCGGVGRATHRIRLAAATAGDGVLLNQALAVEQRAIAAYTAAGPLLPGIQQQAARLFLSQELQHAGELRKLVKLTGAKAHDPEPRYDLGQPHGAAQLLELLHEVERQQLAAYLTVLPRVSSPELRRALAAIMANDAQHVSVLRALQGSSALAGPFPSAAQ